MPQTYIRESGIDLEKQMLKMAGMPIKENPEAELKPIKCTHCEELNEATSKYCSKCERPLDPDEIKRIETEREEEVRQLKKHSEELAELKEYMKLVTDVMGGKKEMDDQIENAYLETDEFEKEMHEKLRKEANQKLKTK